MKKRCVALVLAVVILLALSGCKSQGAPSLPASSASLPGFGPVVSSGGSSSSAAQPATGAGLDEPTFEQRVLLFAANTAGGLMDGGGNACYSPLSLYMALALVGMGAQGETLEELLDVLQLPGEGLDALADRMQGLMRTLQFAYGDAGTGDNAPATGDGDLGPPTVVEGGPLTPHALSIANSVWVSDRYALTDAFAQVAAGKFLAPAATVDFTDTATAERISHWVGEQTNGALAPAYVFDANTVMALVNSIYLADSWTAGFNEGDNSEGLFYLGDGGTVSCTYMNKQMNGRAYISGEGFTGLTLGLTGSAGVTGGMTFILPDEGVTPAALLGSPERLFSVLSTQQDGDVDITLQLPKFGFDYSLKPGAVLQGQGMRLAFGPNAQFPGLAVPAGGADGPPIYIGAIQQDCHIAIDEEGVEAAAATLLEPVTLAMPEQVEEIELVFNRPFLFVVSYNGLPLFTGVVANPAAG